MIKNHGVTVGEIAAVPIISHGSAHHIIHEMLKFNMEDAMEAESRLKE